MKTAMERATARDQVEETLHVTQKEKQKWRELLERKKNIKNRIKKKKSRGIQKQKKNKKLIRGDGLHLRWLSSRY